MNLPLHAQHIALGADMADFAGYAMPMHYGDIITEHHAVRQACGLFDCSHMGEFLLRGENAAAALDALLTNRFDNLTPGRARYALLCNENGGVVDDLIVLCLDRAQYLLIVNASNRQKDFDWIKNRLPSGVTLEDQSNQTALLALQGPKAEAILELLDVKGLPRRYFDFSADASVAGIPCLLSRTGYTGEDGFELACRPEDAPKLWDALMEAGKPLGLLPCGLGARDTLRLEAGLPLYGHELGADVTPLEAGLGFAVKTNKPHFIGREALLDAPKRCLAGLKATGRGIMRQDCPVLLDGAPIGVCTSGTFCPTLGGAAAMTLLDLPAPPPPGTAVQVNVRGRMVPAEIAALPLYKRTV